jgi:hypothetical protein
MNPEDEAPECRTCHHEGKPESSPPCVDCRNGDHYEPASNIDLLAGYNPGLVAGAGIVVGLIFGAVGGFMLGVMV